VTRSFLSLSVLSDTDVSSICQLVTTAARTPEVFNGALSGRVVGLWFAVPSTRTRSSFWRAALDLSANVMSFGPFDLQKTTGESFLDTGHALSNTVDILVVRTNGPDEELHELANGHPAVINAMSRCEHPTQAIGDFATIQERRGDMDNLRLSYFGEGNNTAAALALLFSILPGATLRFYTPKMYSISDALLAAAQARAERCGSRIFVEHSIPAALPKADVIYTTRWQTMGVPHLDPSWRDDFEPFRVDAALFERVAEDDSIFMHDLPAMRGEEVTKEVLDSVRSVAWHQAFHKITGAKATLAWCTHYEKHAQRN
jgi:ornithine carbamoyltransferase